jgi:CHAD domain-containing protein
MKDKKHHEFMIKLDECFKIVQQSGTKGISAVDIAKKIGIYRTTVYDRLNSLEVMNKVESKHGIWYAKTGEQSIKPIEKEIQIVLPVPNKQLEYFVNLGNLANLAESHNLSKLAKRYRNELDLFKETRTIRIKGTNIKELDLEKIGKLIQEVTKKTSKFKFKGLIKKNK